MFNFPLNFYRGTPPLTMCTINVCPGASAPLFPAQVGPHQTRAAQAVLRAVAPLPEIPAASLAPTVRLTVDWSNESLSGKHCCKCFAKNQRNLERCERKRCETRRKLKNEALVVKIGVDTALNERRKGGLKIPKS